MRPPSRKKAFWMKKSRFPGVQRDVARVRSTETSSPPLRFAPANGRSATAQKSALVVGTGSSRVWFDESEHRHAFIGAARASPGAKTESPCKQRPSGVDCRDAFKIRIAVRDVVGWVGNGNPFVAFWNQIYRAVFEFDYRTRGLYHISRVKQLFFTYFSSARRTCRRRPKRYPRCGSRRHGRRRR